MSWRLRLYFSDGETVDYYDLASKADAKREYYDACDGWSAGRGECNSDIYVEDYEIWKE